MSSQPNAGGRVGLTMRNSCALRPCWVSLKHGILRHTLGAGNVGGVLTYHAQSGFITSTKYEYTGYDGTQGSPSTWGKIPSSRSFLATLCGRRQLNPKQTLSQKEIKL